MSQFPPTPEKSKGFHWVSGSWHQFGLSSEAPSRWHSHWGSLEPTYMAANLLSSSRVSSSYLTGRIVCSEFPIPLGEGHIPGDSRFFLSAGWGSPLPAWSSGITGCPENCWLGAVKSGPMNFWWTPFLKTSACPWRWIIEIQIWIFYYLAIFFMRQLCVLQWLGCSFSDSIMEKYIDLSGWCQGRRSDENWFISPRAACVFNLSLPPTRRGVGMCVWGGRLHSQDSLHPQTLKIRLRVQPWLWFDVLCRGW